MKLRAFVVVFFALVAAEIVAACVLLMRPVDTRQDTVAVNRLLYGVAENWDALNETTVIGPDCVVLNADGTVRYRMREGLSESLAQAVAHRDTVLDVTVDGLTVGKLIVYNDTDAVWAGARDALIGAMVGLLIGQALVGATLFLYLRRRVLRPFVRLKRFAADVAAGRLDAPLHMDRGNLFGAYTESFDLMRTQLKAARFAADEADRSKKELVAKLSHDIRTPVASIKAAAELGQAVAASERDATAYRNIIGKADQINGLVSDLFTATLEELEQLAVQPVPTESGRVAEMLSKADYRNRARIPALPDCLVSCDPVRLQQVFDNLFSNSYKYADTQIELRATLTDTLDVRIEDAGGGVSAAELKHLTEKYARGANAAGKEGAGLGLYIAASCLTEMGGALKLENTEKGLAAVVSIALAR